MSAAAKKAAARRLARKNALAELQATMSRATAHANILSSSIEIGWRAHGGGRDSWHEHGRAVVRELAAATNILQQIVPEPSE